MASAQNKAAYGGYGRSGSLAAANTIYHNGWRNTSANGVALMLAACEEISHGEEAKLANGESVAAVAWRHLIAASLKAAGEMAAKMPHRRLATNIWLETKK